MSMCVRLNVSLKGFHGYYVQECQILYDGRLASLHLYHFIFPKLYLILQQNQAIPYISVYFHAFPYIRKSRKFHKFQITSS